MIKDFVQNELFVGVMGVNEFKEFQTTLSLEDRANVVLISISEPDNEEYLHPTMTVGFHDVLQTKFWDLEESIVNYEVLTDEQGEELREFIEKNKSKRFLIHCKAGMSRSAGVAKAAECIVQHDGNVYQYKTSKSALSDYPRYCANLTVFDKIMKG